MSHCWDEEPTKNCIIVVVAFGMGHGIILVMVRDSRGNSVCKTQWESWSAPILSQSLQMLLIHLCHSRRAGHDLQIFPYSWASGYLSGSILVTCPKYLSLQYESDTVVLYCVLSGVCVCARRASGESPLCWSTSTQQAKQR